MLIFELFEQKSKKHASLVFGRMNPPTIGHAKLINTAAASAHDGNYFIFLSHTQDAKKNPLSFSEKANFLAKLMPVHAGHIVDADGIRTVLDALTWLYNKNYTDVTFVAGSDRLPTFKNLINKYNGVQLDSGNYYKFDSINYVSSGDRDPDDEDGVEGISASLARNAAATGNFEKFKKATGAGQHAQALYDAVRRGMMIDNLATEDASGYIPKNKREANDPRWKTALSVDVNPDTPRKNAKALRLV